MKSCAKKCGVSYRTYPGVTLYYLSNIRYLRLLFGFFIFGEKMKAGVKEILRKTSDAYEFPTQIEEFSSESTQSSIVYRCSDFGSQC